MASLRKILGGLGVTMSEFFEPDAPSTQAVFFKPHELRDLTTRLYTTLDDPRGKMTLQQVGMRGRITCRSSTNATNPAPILASRCWNTPRMKGGRDRR
ncbi:hypothetical protein ACFSHQ_01305 [Gemmobacter lanyuensis]